MKRHYSKNRRIGKLSFHFSTIILSLTGFFLINFSAISQNLGVNATGTSPDASAGLDVDFKDKGLLMPRLTTSERNTINSPANGLMIYNTDCNVFQFWDNTSWISFPISIPTANAGTNISKTSFNANWTASSGAIAYYLDVATDADFTTFVSGFNNSNIGNVTTYNVYGLTCGTDYYYRVRAENGCGLGSYSNTITVTVDACCSSNLLTDSRDSKTYQTVQIGNQCWMKENLNYNPGSGNSWCYANNNSNCTTYGRLYDWNTAMDNSSSSSLSPSGVQGVCPSGWHLPSDAEWCQMENTVEPGIDASCSGTGMRGTVAGKHLKASSPSWNGDNAIGFSALPAGNYVSGSFGSIGSSINFWSATENSGTNAWYRVLYSTFDEIGRANNNNKSKGWSVRCIED